MIHIIDAYDSIYKFFPENNFDMNQYDLYASSVSPNLLNLIMEDVADYDFDKEILPCIQYFFKSKKSADAARDSFVKATDSLLAKYEDVLKNKIDITVIFHLGLCNGAGWVTRLNEKPVILIGVEKVVELNWFDEKNMSGLIYHEIGHALHFQNRTVETILDTPRQKALWRLYTEGMAMYLEQALIGDFSFYHQDKNEWLNWNRNNLKRNGHEYIIRFENNESVQDFFGDWNNFNGYSDVGYFLGCEAIREINKTHTIEELINLNIDTFEDYIKNIFL